VLKHSRVNIFDVANHAGVAVSTVSRVLNGSTKVSDATRTKVLLAIETLDFKPSRLASSLSKGRFDNVAIVAPFLTRPSVVTRIDGALDFLDQTGHSTVLYSVSKTSQRDHYFEALMDQHEATGVIVISVPMMPEHIRKFQSAGVALSLVDTIGEGTAQVTIDDQLGGRLATNHLIEEGHSRIGFIGDLIKGESLKFSSSRERLIGMVQALTANGLTHDESLVKLGDHSAEAARVCAQQLLESANPPSAIFAASDTQAIGALVAAESLGRKVPQDLAIIGFDDLEVTSLLDLSTVRQHLHESGRLGAQRLTTLMEGKKIDEPTLLMDIEVVVRSSTKGERGSSLSRIIS
ncbi:unnamed protein product, partial [Acidithrix sp. C25]